MRIFIFVLGLVVSVALLSCQKQISEGEPDNPTGGDRLLTKYIYSDDTQSWTDTFLFDAQNRVIRINELYFDSSSPSPSPYYWFWEMHYNGNETLPFKITDTSQGRDMNWYILYDAQKRKTVDSIVYTSPADRFVTYYSYQGNKVVAKTYSTDAGGISSLSSADTLISDGSNWIKYSYVNPLFPGNGYTLDVTYDNHPNPFSTLNSTPATHFTTGFQIGDFSQSGKNNGLNFTYTSTFGGVLKYQYVYDAEGYPVSSSWFEQSDPSIHGTEKFVYKK